GKKAKCNKCQGIFLIPGETVIRATAPVLAPTGPEIEDRGNQLEEQTPRRSAPASAGPRHEDEYLDEEYEERRRRRAGKKKKKEFPVLLVALLGGGALFGLIVVGVVVVVVVHLLFRSPETFTKSGARAGAKRAPLAAADLTPLLQASQRYLPDNPDLIVTL